VVSSPVLAGVALFTSGAIFSIMKIVSIAARKGNNMLQKKLLPRQGGERR
jgi:hypothetical protein